MADTISPKGIHVNPDGTIARVRYFAEHTPAGMGGASAGPGGAWVPTGLAFDGLGGDLTLSLGFSAFGVSVGPHGFLARLRDLVSGATAWGPVLADFPFDVANQSLYIGRPGGHVEGDFGSSYEFEVSAFTADARIKGDDVADCFVVIHPQIT